MKLQNPKVNEIEKFNNLGHNNFLYTYLDLKANSNVLIIGGYKGDHAHLINSIYGCNIYIYEPIKEYFKILKNRFVDDCNIHIFNSALSSDGRTLEMNLANDATHLSSLGNLESRLIERVKSIPIDDVLTEFTSIFDLAVINIEGMEYEILPKLLANIEKLPRVLVFQRHNISGISREQDQHLDAQLGNNYVNIYKIEYIWERWQLRNPVTDNSKLKELIKLHFDSNLSQPKFIATTRPTTTFFFLATSIYYDFFKDAILDLEKAGFANEIEVVVLTDRNTNFVHSPQFKIWHIFVEDEPWPDITLLRFSKLIKFNHWIRGEYVVWSDADMKFKKKFDAESVLDRNEICLSRHPGFSISLTKISKNRNINFLGMVFKRIQINLKHKFSLQGWECNLNSKAYVPWYQRRVYVQGGFWIAKRDSAVKMANTIQNLIKWDLLQNHIPVYHDESYLNFYFAKHKTGLLPRDFVGVSTYWWQESNKFHVECVEKGFLRV